MVKFLLQIAITILGSNVAFADCERGMGPGMIGGLCSFWIGLYALLCITAVIIFFWLMFRITWALEAIAKAKEEGNV